MQDRGLYEKILGIERPWSVRDVELSREEKRVIVRLTRAQSPVLRCPTCDATGPKYDRRTRRWRHLDTCQFKTIIEAEVPRITCSEHGVVQVSVPWAESGSRFTALFEALVISWLHEASILGVSRQMSLSWDEAAGIQERAVRRGLARRKCEPSVRISVDETSFRKRHKYVTVVSDQDTTNVVYVADGRETEALNGYYESIGEEACASLESVSMDMWQGYITATRNHVPNADQIIAFDKFHIVQHLGNAVDKVRREENRELTAAGDNRLKGTKWMWLPEGRPCLGAQGGGHVPLGLRVPRLGEESLEALVQLGDPKSTRTDEAGCADDRQPSGGYPDRGRDRSDKRLCREPQRQDPVGQENGLRVPKSRPIPQRHLLPPRWTGSVPKGLCATHLKPGSAN